VEPNSEQLTARIAATRDELSDNLDELGHRMKDAVNWRTQYQKHTALFLGAAVVGGVAGAAGADSSARLQPPSASAISASTRTGKRTDRITMLDLLAFKRSPPGS
jgi:hypothetical protein